MLKTLKGIELVCNIIRLSALSSAICDTHDSVLMSHPLQVRCSYFRRYGVLRHRLNSCDVISIILNSLWTVLHIDVSSAEVGIFLENNGCWWFDEAIPSAAMTWIDTMTLQWGLWHLKSPASRLFSQPFIEAQIRNKKIPKLRITDSVRGIHRWPVNSPHKCPVTRKMFPFDDVIMNMRNKRSLGRD